MKKKLSIKLIVIMLSPIIFIANIITKRYPKFIENYYSTSANKGIRQLLSLITSIFPTSLAEFLIPSLFLILIVGFIFLLVKIKKGGFSEQVINLSTYVSVLYVLFMVLWGFNYNRLSFDKIAGLEITRSSKQELYDLCESLIDRANTLRGKVEENSQGVMTVSGGYKDVFKRAQKGYDKAAKLYPELGGKYGPPKKILVSKKMSYTGITGIYIPYTGEANVNINITDYMLPNTAAHEMAHQRGFAREDEANYIAYIACTMHPDADFQYSGVMLAIVYSMNALADVDRDMYKQLLKSYTPGVRRDINNDIEFWQKYKGKVEEVANKVNNTYLKSNGQQDGVQSYGRMVDLLLAEYKKEK
ncbi:DUF3810 domain-containing protein [Clostridium swellfunianum]|uniref:DUF3810 domain-containing protein n=1 Tax=Clostridium swellfunianum TaxID=1367462 RepID=UPI00202ECB89|nr:DUF3810 domain-containing protein [Clostridium swellfunianum]MCM0649269.1 DUF3810 domain-containing protein [Clostridium swellfunianum]